MDFVNKEINVRTEPVGKQFGDDLEDDVKKTNGSEIINQGSTFFGMKAPSFFGMRATKILLRHLRSTVPL